MTVLDDIDRRIVEELERDGRLSNVELAERVGLSPSPCLRRVRRLEHRGVVRGYRALVDPDAIGRGFRVFVAVDLSAHDRPALEDFERTAVRLPGVQAVHHMAGTFDYLLHVEVADLAAYDHFTREVVTRLPNLARVTSHIVMSTVERGD